MRLKRRSLLLKAFKILIARDKNCSMISIPDAVCIVCSMMGNVR
jgi:hypothetical protein